jgi:hypothetical protein
LFNDFDGTGEGLMMEAMRKIMKIENSDQPEDQSKRFLALENAQIVAQHAATRGGVVYCRTAFL